MAVDSYIFWCSKCKKDHAGECPPKEITFVVKMNPAPKVSINRQQIQPFTGGSISYQPQPSQGFPPGKGTLWYIEDWHAATGWVQRAGDYTYEVRDFDAFSDRVKLKHVTTGVEVWIERTCWEPAGFAVSSTSKIRFALSP